MKQIALNNGEIVCVRDFDDSIELVKEKFSSELGNHLSYMLDDNYCILEWAEDEFESAMKEIENTLGYLGEDAKVSIMPIIKETKSKMREILEEVENPTLYPT